jgi:SAM-dependent methyltransferase
MESNTEKYINDWFINLDSQKLPASFYLIRKSLLKAVDELRPKLHGTVLDLACGVMPYKNYLMNNPAIKSYKGVDLEPTEYHNTIKPDHYWDGKSIPLPDNSCDFVIATEFLEHYFDTIHILQEIKRVLKSGGQLFFTVPCIWPMHEVPYDYHRFTTYSLAMYFNISGFTSWDIKPLGGFNYSLALMMALWNDYKLTRKKQRFFKPFMRFAINQLQSKEVSILPFDNGQIYSGLFGFVTK